MYLKVRSYKSFIVGRTVFSFLQGTLFIKNIRGNVVNISVLSLSLLHMSMFLSFSFGDEGVV